jgi:hypothetical protein
VSECRKVQVRGTDGRCEQADVARLLPVPISTLLSHVARPPDRLRNPHPSVCRFQSQLVVAPRVRHRVCAREIRSNSSLPAAGPRGACQKSRTTARRTAARAADGLRQLGPYLHMAATTNVLKGLSPGARSLPVLGVSGRLRCHEHPLIRMPLPPVGRCSGVSVGYQHRNRRRAPWPRPAMSGG